LFPSKFGANTIKQTRSAINGIRVALSNLVRNVPLLTSLEMSPFGFDLLFLSSLALPAAEPCAA
jgi:hypothetical protein